MDLVNTSEIKAAALRLLTDAGLSNRMVAIDGGVTL